MNGWVWAGGGALASGLLTAAVVHYGYARNNYQAAKVAVKISRAVWLSRLGQLIAVVVVLAALAWVIGSGPQR